MIKNGVILLMIFLLFVSCKEEHSSNSIEPNEITNEFRLQFLNEILLDTLGLKLIKSKRDLISNANILPPYISNKFPQESHYISEVLAIHDTLFVQKQFELNPMFSFDDLSKFGFKILDVKSMVKNGEGYDSIMDELNLYYKNCENCCLLFLSKPIFNKEKSKAYLRTGCGSGGVTLILERKINSWVIIEEIDYWVE
jgi:hypothetical protein